MFFNKAQNLEYLKNLNIKEINIPNFTFFSVLEWKRNKKLIIKNIKDKLKNKICIRSSFYKEDNSKHSLAGKFDSFINIENNTTNIKKAVNNLSKQYKNFHKNIIDFDKNFFLVQDFVNKSICSGVVTNFTLGEGAPYYTINYNDLSSSTSSVTSGDKDSFRVLHVSKFSKNNLRSSKFKRLIKAIKIIENNYKNIPIDIEFAITENHYVNILQIRPISTAHKWKHIDNKIFYKLLSNTEKKYNKIKARNIRYGKKAIFGLMPDWNPAEIIGFQPSLFSYSLYKYLVTDRIWANAREKMGYKKLKKPKLMYSFTGKPFIDLRMSFNSLLPSNLEINLQKKITNYWLDELKIKPFYHDKIEFEITDNCFYFGLNKKINLKYKFLNKIEKNKFYFSLKKLTNNILLKYSSDFKKMNNDILKLENYRTKIINEYLNNKKSEILYSKKLLGKCKKLGLVPFAMQARNAFISKKILNSLIDCQIINKSTYFKILSKLQTVSHDYIKEKKNFKKEISKKNKFNKKYYHLRPNSYDILNKRYISKIQENKLDKDQIQSLLNYKNIELKNILNKNENLKLNKALKKNQINISVKNLLNFFIGSLKLRENYKFIFTRTLSDGLELLRKYSQKKKIYKKISNIDIKDIFKLNKSINLNRLNKINNSNNIKSKYFDLVKLPYLIVSNNDFFVSSILISKPNFITEKNISGDLLFLDGKSKKNNLKNKIVVIENADPGFDWIFSYNIKGLITKFGGINSHMSIRCEELNIPAIIGFGEDNYSKIINLKKINVNCKLQKVNFGELKNND